MSCFEPLQVWTCTRNKESRGILGISRDRKIPAIFRNPQDYLKIIKIPHNIIIWHSSIQNDILDVVLCQVLRKVPQVQFDFSSLCFIIYDTQSWVTKRLCREFRANINVWLLVRASCLLRGQHADAWNDFFFSWKYLTTVLAVTWFEMFSLSQPYRNGFTQAEHMAVRWMQKKVK